MDKILSALLIAFALTACAPIPNRRTFAPAVAGTVVRGGVPVANAEVLLTTRFSDAAATVRTDADGRFRLGPLSEMRVMKTLLGDPLYEYTLKIRVAGEEEHLGLAGHGMGNASKELTVTCDLSKPIGQGKSLRYCL